MNASDAKKLAAAMNVTQGRTRIARYGERVADKTYCISKIDGDWYIELHTHAINSHYTLLNMRAATLLNQIDKSLDGENGLYATLTDEQKKEVQDSIVGYDYILIK